jgi:amidohydrolase
MIEPKLLNKLKAWRQYLHQHPELSGEEVETSAFICAKLDELGIPHMAGIGGTGVVASLARGSSNRSVGLRADFDALPITELNNFSYASQNVGVMHACGHDGHTVSLLGAAAVLMRDRSWSGTIHFVFQPGEENGTGAKSMIADGLFDRFPMERLFAFHNLPGLDVGKAAVHDGPSLAAGGDWRVTLKGISGHAATPHATRDPIHAAGHLIVALNSIVSRYVDPIDTVVLTVSSIHGGTVSNQIPETVELVGTLRTFKQDVRVMVIERMTDMIEGNARAFGLKADYAINSTGRPMADTPDESRLAILAAEKAGLPVTRDIRPFMGGDDFAFLVKDRPGAYIHIGNGPVRDGGKLHNERYDFNDDILPATVGWFATVAKLALEA